MWWNVGRYQHVWEKFTAEDVTKVVRQYPGDQDYLFSFSIIYLNLNSPTSIWEFKIFLQIKFRQLKYN